MKLKSYLTISACVTAVAFCGHSSALAASKKSATASPSPSASAAASPAAADKPARAIPFHGTVSSVDATAKTFTIAGKANSRVFKVTDTTTVTKDGAAATFADITAEGKVSGSYLKQADGSLECKSVKVGGAADSGAAGSKKKSKKEEAGAAASASPSAAPAKK